MKTQLYTTGNHETKFLNIKKGRKNVGTARGHRRCLNVHKCQCRRLRRHTYLDI